MFKLNIEISDKEKNRRCILYSITALVLMTMFTVGFITVYVNSYNIMHAEPMEVFCFCRTSDGIGIILFNHFFKLM